MNVLKGKKLTNIRTTSKDEAVRLTPPIRMTLEKALAYIEDDELVEVTPKSIRLRKKLLDENDRKKKSGRKKPKRFERPARLIRRESDLNHLPPQGRREPRRLPSPGHGTDRFHPQLKL
mgnify:CR=1 FL=1